MTNHVISRLRNAMTGGSFAHRIGRGLSAQAYCRGVAIFTQLVSIPILLAAWGTDLFGVWLLLSTVPTYLNLMNAGFNSIAGNDMTMRVAEGDWVGARRALHSICVLFMVVFGGICTIAVGCVLVLWQAGYLAFETVGADDVAVALLALVGTVLVAKVQALAGCVARATRRLPQSLVWMGTTQLVETSALMAAATLGGSIGVAALAALAARTVVAGAMLLAMTVQVPSLRIGVKLASLTTIRAFLAPSFGALLLNVNNAMTMQGPLIVIGMFAGPAAVAVFSVCRTFARTGFQLVGSLNIVLEPEYSRLFRTSGEKYIRLFRHNLVIACGLSILVFAAVGLVGVDLITLYTSGNIDPPYLLLMLVAACVSLEIVWRVFLTAVFSINQHVRVSIYMTVAGVLSFGLMFVFGSVWSVAGVVVALVVYDAGVLVMSAREFYRVIGRSWTASSDGSGLTSPARND